MDSVVGRFRLRLLPALITASGVILIGNGLMSYTTAVEPVPTERPLVSFLPMPTLDTGISLPGGSLGVTPTFPPDRVATRVVVRRLGIDLPVILQTGEYGDYPVCDVALYLPFMGQPGQGRATYLYAHARDGMFLPLLTWSRIDNGARLIGLTVEVYTSDNWRFLYRIVEVRRHTTDLNDAANATTERLWLQTSEGPAGTVPKLQVVADYLSSEKTDPQDAHPNAVPRICTESGHL